MVPQRAGKPKEPDATVGSEFGEVEVDFQADATNLGIDRQEGILVEVFARAPAYCRASVCVASASIRS